MQGRSANRSAAVQRELGALAKKERKRYFSFCPYFIPNGSIPTYSHIDEVIKPY